MDTFDFIPTGGDPKGIQTGYCICKKCGTRVETGISNLSEHWAECSGQFMFNKDGTFTASGDLAKTLKEHKFNGSNINPLLPEESIVFNGPKAFTKLKEQNEKLIQTLRLVYSTLQLLDLIVDGDENASAAVDEITLAVAEVLDDIDKDKQKPDIC